jgi:hypothetical protein
MICPYCKETILVGAIKCKHCGSMLNLDSVYGMNNDNVTTDEIRAFVGQNAYYYIQKFSYFTILGREKFCITWNWSCCGFTFLWFLYRKMYVLAIISFVIFCIPGINFFMHIVVGVLGNYLYYRHCKEKIIEVRSTQSQQNYVPVLQELGGVNRWVITLAIIISIVMAVIFAVFFSTMVGYVVQNISKITI